MSVWGICQAVTPVTRPATGETRRGRSVACTDLTPYGRIERRELVHPDLGRRSYRQVPATAPSTSTVLNECGVRRAEDPRPVLARAGSRCRRACTSRVASQTGRNRTGTGGVAASAAAPGAGRPGAVPSSARNRAQRQPVAAPRPPRRPAAPAQSAISAGGTGRSRPGSGAPAARRPSSGSQVGLGPSHCSAGVQVGPAPLPGARRRYPDQVQPVPDAPSRSRAVISLSISVWRSGPSAANASRSVSAARASSASAGSARVTAAEPVPAGCAGWPGVNGQ